MKYYWYCNYFIFQRESILKEILEKLNLSAVNPGSWSGTQSMQTDKEKLIESINPSSKEVIASVINTNNDEYEQIIKKAQ